MKRIFVSILILFPLTLAAQEGLKMVTEVVERGNKEMDRSTSTIYLGQSHMRSDANNNGEKTSTIYDDKKRVLYTIDHEDKSYQKITEEDIEKMEEQMKRAKEQMKNMPESQRAQMKKMMGQKFNHSPDIEYQKTGNTKSVSPWGTCQEYKGMQDGEMVQKVYTTSLDNVQVEKEHFDILRSMIDFISFLPHGMDRYYPVSKNEGRENRNGLKGFGVLWYYFEDGERTQETRIKELKEKNLKESLFQVPDGYEGKETKTGTRGRR